MNAARQQVPQLSVQIAKHSASSQQGRSVHIHSTPQTFLAHVPSIEREFDAHGGLSFFLFSGDI